MSNIEVSKLTVKFDEKQVFNNFSYLFLKNRTTFVMGPSGCGKTTLLRVMLGLISPDSGKVTGVPDKVSVVFQEDRLSESFSVLSNIRMVTGRSVSTEEIEAHLKALGLGDEIKTPVCRLSGGMKRRVAIARAVLFGGDAIFLDEAFKGLDEETKLDAMEYFRAHTRGKTVIAVTHDPSETDFFGGNVLEL